MESALPEGGGRTAGLAAGLPGRLGSRGTQGARPLSEHSLPRELQVLEHGVLNDVRSFRPLRGARGQHVPNHRVLPRIFLSEQWWKFEISYVG